MGYIVFRYRSRELDVQDIDFISGLISKHYSRGRSYISCVLCEAWQWKQPNGKLKEYAARDLLLRLEEAGFIELPPRLRPKNNLKQRSFDQIPLFLKDWASAAWKVKARDQFIGWDELTKRKNLHLIANNTRFLILPWVRVKYLASKILSLSIRQLSTDWEKTYGHPVYLAETFVDISRFNGTCYRAANWIEVGRTKGNAKKGNTYHYHGQSKAIYLYPLHHRFRRFLLDDQG